MATFNLEKAQVLADGRVVRLWWVTRPVPTLRGFPDWMPAANAGQHLVLSNGGIAECIGSHAFDWDRYPPDSAFSDDLTSTIPIGNYFFRFAIADAGGNEVHQSDLMGALGSWDGEPIEIVEIQQKITFKWYDAIPANHTGRIYCSRTNAKLEGAADDLGLLVTDIPAGMTGYTLQNLTWAAIATNFVAAQYTWMQDWLLPADAEVALGETVTFDAPSGIIRDEHGNVTAAANDAALENLSMMDGTGWCTHNFTPTPVTGKILYVAPAPYGDNANLGTNIAAPKATLQSAYVSLAQRSCSTVRLLRGGVYASSASLNGKWGLDGDRMSPTVLEDYSHDYGQSFADVRPVVECTGPFVSWHTGNSDHFENWIMRRVKIRGIGYSKGSTSWGIYSKNTLLSDCEFDNAKLGPEHVAGHHGENNCFHKCTIYDNRDPINHVSGAFISGSYGCLVSQCCFDRNGYNDDDFLIRDDLNHNVYVQTKSVMTCFWGNWISKGCNFGIQQRGGGTISYNVFSRNNYDVLHYRHSGWQRGNWHLNAYGAGSASFVGAGTLQENLSHACLEFNIVSNADTPGALGIRIREGNDYLNHARNIRRYAKARHCLAIGYDVPSDGGSEEHPVGSYLERCILMQPANDVCFLYTVTGGTLSLAKLFMTQNVYATNGTNVVRTAFPAETNYTLAAWKALGKDTGSLHFTPTLINSLYGLAEHSLAHGGPATEDDFLLALHTRPSGVWTDFYSAYAAIQGARLAYSPTNLAQIDAGVHGYYGPNDYRELAGIYITAGPATLEREQTGTFTITPTGPPAANYVLSDGGTPPGTFSPSIIIWTGAQEDARNFNYTPHDSTGGSREIVATTGVTPSASRIVAITEPGAPPEVATRPTSLANWGWF